MPLSLYTCTDLPALHHRQKANRQVSKHMAINVEQSDDNMPSRKRRHSDLEKLSKQHQQQISTFATLSQ